MSGFFGRLFGRTDGKDKDAKSGKVAKDRLQFVLVQDRINLPADKLQSMKAEIIQVISKYVAVDLDNVDFNLSNRERNGLLIAEIPFVTVVPQDPTSEPAVSSTADSVPMPDEGDVALPDDAVSVKKTNDLKSESEADDSGDELEADNSEPTNEPTEADT